MIVLGSRNRPETIRIAACSKQFCRSSAQLAGNVNRVSGAGAGAEKSVIPLDGPEQDNIGCDQAGVFSAALVELGRLGRVAAGKGHFVSIGEGEKAVEETVGPVFLGPALAGAGSVEFGGHAEGQECGQRPGAHRSNVAQATCETAVTDHFRNVPVTPEVDLFEGKVRGDDKLICGVDTQNGGIIADADAKAALRPRSFFPDGGNQRPLSGG
jgi:hypothetical protein